MDSLIIGFCSCAECGWTNGKFNWHTYFKCPVCGSKEFRKEFKNEAEWTEEEGSVFCGHDTAVSSSTVDDFSSDWNLG